MPVTASKKFKRGVSRQTWRRLLLNRSPKYWALALLLLLCRLLVALPRTWLLTIGRLLGLSAGRLSKKLRHITRANIEACFPQMDTVEREQLIDKTFRELGISVVETWLIWFGNTHNLYHKYTRIVGEDHWRQALESGRGVVLMACHHGSLDMNASFASFLVRQQRRYAFTYRQPSDAMVDMFLRDARSKYSDHFFPVNNLVGILRALKRGGVVWYAPDIEVKNKNSVFSEFFGVPASTTLALNRIVESSQAIVLPYAHYREADDLHYALHFYPPLENYPSGDKDRDTRAMNQAIEALVRPFPARYWWAIKRFKNRPAGEKPIY